MSFDDFLSDLQGTMATQKMPEYYDLHLHEHKDMAPYQRQAHIRSMKHSQMHDYKAKLRVVITDQDELLPGADPWKADSYLTPDIGFAIDIADEAVIRRDGREFAIKARAGKLGFR